MGRVILPFRPSTGTDSRIYTYEGWRAFVNAPAAVRPERLTRARYAALSASERKAYDEARKQYMMRFGPLNTPALDMVKRRVKEQMEANLRAPRDEVKVGMVVDGHATLGKSTIAKVIARQFELSMREEAEFPNEESRDQFIPVVHVTLQRNTTPKALAEQICNYLNIPLRDRTPRGRRQREDAQVPDRMGLRPGEGPPHRKTEAQLVDLIYQAVDRHDILLFVLDDIHFLRIRSKDGAEISKFLKSLMTSTGATFIFVGVDVEQMGFLEEYGNNSLDTSQTAGRCLHLPIQPFARGSAEWRRLIQTVDDHLILLDHEPGTLVKHASLLYNRTGGSLGSVMNLIRKTAVAAVGKGERIDADVLRRAAIDYRATKSGNLEET